MSHIAILPLDIIHTLSATLQHDDTTRHLVFLKLPHPRTGVQSLFLPSSNQETILELQAVSPPEPRSWFIGDEVIADGKLLIMTPIDPVFILIPILQIVHPIDGSTGTYRTIDDIFDEAALKFEPMDSSIPGKDILRFGSLKCVKEALIRICEMKEITPEIVVYRLSLPKILDYLRVKVVRLASSEVLELSRTVIRRLAKDGLMEDGKEGLLKVGHIRMACDLLSQYISPEIRASLLALYDFTELDAHFTKIEDETAARAVVEKKGKTKAKLTVGEGKKRKGPRESHGVEQLKKANVNGMAKLSSFFSRTGSDSAI